MPSTYSPLLRFEEIGPGEQSGLWGDTTNKNIGELVEQAIAGVTTVSLSGGAGDYTLSVLNGALDESRGAVLKFIGSPSGPKNIIIPTSTKLYVVRNECGQTISVKTAAQVTGVTILNGEATLVFCDGANAVAGIATAGVGPTTVANGGTGVTSFVGGFIKSPGGTGALTSSGLVSLASEVTGTLPVPSGGTGASSLASGRVLLGNGTAAVNAYAGLANGHVLTWDGTAWVSQAPSGGVLTFSGGTTGLTPAAASSGVITLGGTLALTNGGTGATTQSDARTNLGLGSVSTINLSGSNSTFLRGDGIFATPVTNLTAGTGISVSSPTGSSTITNTGVTFINAGSGISVTGNTGSVTISSTSSGGVTSVSAASPLSSTGGTTPQISISTSPTFSGTVTANELASTRLTMTGATSIGDLRLQLSGSGMTSGMSPSGVQLGASGWGIIYGFAPDITILGGGSGLARFTPGGINFQGNGSSTWATPSDINIKTNLRSINNALGKLTSLNPCHFEYKDELGKTRSGFIAQEFETVFPGHTIETGVPEKYKEFVPAGVNKLKALDLNLVPYLVKAIQELKAELDEAKAEIAALKAK